MIKALTLYPASMDQETINSLVLKAISSMKQYKGLQSIEENKGQIMSPAGPPAYSKIMTATWDLMENFWAWVQSPDAQEDKDHLIENGVSLLIYEVNEV